MFSLATIDAQYVWYENSSIIKSIPLTSTTRGTFTNDETNPEIDSINSNPIVSKFVRDGRSNPRIQFDLNNPITDLSSYTISLKARLSLATADLNTTNSRIRLNLRNASIGGPSNIFIQANFTQGNTWELFTFDFDGTTIPADVIAAGGYNQLIIIFASGDDAGLQSTYYIDAITGSSDQVLRNAAFLSGSWGLRLNLDGGYLLDETSNDDWVGGAQQVVDNLPTVDYVMTLSLIHI